MKINLTFKKSLLIILAVVFAHTIFTAINEITIPNVIANVEDAKADISKDDIVINNEYSYYRQSLTSSKLLALYDDICKTVASKQTTVTIPTGISDDDIAIIIDYVKLDHPELYWFDGDYIETYSSSIKVSYITLMFNDLIDNEDVSKLIEEKTNAIVKYSLENSDTELSKVIHCYTAILDELSYDMYAENNQSIYSAIDTGNTVCFGYSKYFFICLNKLGFENYIIVGNSRETEEGYKAHSWNAVKIDGTWYYFDPTWADSENDPYKYFMIATDSQDFNDYHVPLYTLDF